jgi:hypothetical protein
MKFYSLLTVNAQRGDVIDGVLLQDHFGTLLSALRKAEAISKANSGTRIAVASKLPGSCPQFHVQTDIKAHFIIAALSPRHSETK